MSREHRNIMVDTCDRCGVSESSPGVNERGLGWKALNGWGWANLAGDASGIPDRRLLLCPGCWIVLCDALAPIAPEPTP